MSEEKEEQKPEEAKPPGTTDGTWKHDQELSFKRITTHLHGVKDAMEKAIEYERMKLAKMIGAKDLVKK